MVPSTVARGHGVLKSAGLPLLLSSKRLMAGLHGHQLVRHEQLVQLLCYTTELLTCEPCVSGLQSYQLASPYGIAAARHSAELDLVC